METPKQDTIVIPPMTPNEQMMAFAFMADILGAKKITSQSEGEKKAREHFETAFKNTVISTALNGQWTVLHDPWLTMVGDVERNLTALFLSPDKETLVVAVAGTNFISTYDWFNEDLLTTKLVPWNSLLISDGVSATDTEDLPAPAFISTGSSLALKHTWNQTSSVDGTTVPIYLKTYLEANTNVKNLIVTGHSLGGAISPVFATALADWGNLRSSVNIESYIFAGPTPGDATFVSHVEKTLGGVHSTYNLRDVVPHAWQLDMMGDKILDIFKNSKMSLPYADNSIIANMVAAFTAQSQTALNDGYAYKRWTVEKTFTGDYQDISTKLADDFADDIRLLMADNEQVRGNVYYIVFNKELPSGTTGVYPLVEAQVKYFAQALLVLKNQHIPAYGDDLLTYPKFREELKKADKIEGNIPFAAKHGNAVLISLFALVANYMRKKNS